MRSYLVVPGGGAAAAANGAALWQRQAGTAVSLAVDCQGTIGMRFGAELLLAAGGWHSE